MEELTVNQKLDRILSFLETDPKTNRKGVVEEVADLKIKVQEIITKEKIDESRMTLLGVIGAALFELALWFFQYITKK